MRRHVKLNPTVFPRTTMLGLLAAASVVQIVVLFNEPSDLMRTTVTLRAAAPMGLAVALWRGWVPQRRVEQGLFAVCVVAVTHRLASLGTVGVDRAALTWATASMAVMTLAVLLAPSSQRRRWLGVSYLTGVVPAAATIAPRDPAQFAITGTFLAFLALLLSLLERRGRAAEVTWEAAHTDQLTGLDNRRAMQVHLSAALTRRIEGGQPDALLLLDLDHFKQLNDTRGHVAGDEALRGVAVVLRAVAPPESVIGRWGGEEFMVLLAHVDEARAAELAEQMRIGIAKATATTASIGIAEPQATDDLTDWIHRADQALYRAKEAGRDQVATASTSVRPDLRVSDVVELDSAPDA